MIGIQSITFGYQLKIWIFHHMVIRGVEQHCIVLETYLFVSTNVNSTDLCDKEQKLGKTVTSILYFQQKRPGVQSNCITYQRLTYDPKLYLSKTWFKIRYHILGIEILELLFKTQRGATK